MKNLIKNFLIVFLVLLVIAGLLSFSEPDFGSEESEVVNISRLVNEINVENVKSIDIEGDNIIAELYAADNKSEQGESPPDGLAGASGGKIEVKKEYGQSFSELMDDYGVDKDKVRKANPQVKEETGAKYWLSVLAPYLLPLLLIFGIIFFMSRQVQGINNKAMGFGQTGARQKKPEDQKDKKTFKDVAGAREAKEELEEIVGFLKDPKKFTEMGAKIPKGVLLMGAPGTGKTLLAKAIAGEANVPFFHISGSEFVEMFVGVGASRVRDLFNRAKKTAPAIVFIDEIDAVGRKRGSGLGGSHDEREQTLNQILVEMDGFDPNLGVIVVAATNRPDVLDHALLRPGRFDRRVIIDKPDIKEREEILKVHAKNKPFDKDVNLTKIAERTPGFTGADLENILNEAAILAVRRDKKKVAQDEILESVEKVMLGPQKRSRIMTEKDREMTAYHEAGHAVAAHFLEHCDPVRKVSIIGRGMAGGYTLSMPERDQPYKIYAKFKDELAMMLGGYVVEKMIYGSDHISTGPSNDLKQATAMAKSMVMQYGMSDKLGPRQYGDREELIFLAQEIHEQRNYSEKTAELIDAEINQFLEEAKTRAEEILNKKKDKLDKLVKVLLEKETVEQGELSEIMGDEARK